VYLNINTIHSRLKELEKTKQRKEPITKIILYRDDKLIREWEIRNIPKRKF